MTGSECLHAGLVRSQLLLQNGQQFSAAIQLLQQSPATANCFRTHRKNIQPLPGRHRCRHLLFSQISRLFRQRQLRQRLLRRTRGLQQQRQVAVQLNSSHRVLNGCRRHAQALLLRLLRQLNPLGSFPHSTQLHRQCRHRSHTQPAGLSTILRRQPLIPSGHLQQRQRLSQLRTCLIRPAITHRQLPLLADQFPQLKTQPHIEWSAHFQLLQVTQLPHCCLQPLHGLLLMPQLMLQRRKRNRSRRQPHHRYIIGDQISINLLIKLIVKSPRSTQYILTHPRQLGRCPQIRMIREYFIKL